MQKLIEAIALRVEQRFVILHRHIDPEPALEPLVEMNDMRIRVIQEGGFRAEPSATARPPQKGSTRRRCECGSQKGRKNGTCHRLPPAHFNGGRSETRSTL